MTEKIKKHTISEKADIMHRASSLYMASNIPIDYGTGEMHTPVEAHMLKYIKDHPGKNVTELSDEWDKTKAAISQMLKKMEQKNLIYKENPADNFRKQCFLLRKKGTNCMNTMRITTQKYLEKPCGCLKNYAHQMK